MSSPYPTLNLPPMEMELRDDKIFDPFRRKWLVCTPEEWVRQNFLAYLRHYLGYPRSLIKVEQGLENAGNFFRADAIVYSREIVPLALIECKAPHVTIDDKTFRQIAVYTAEIRARVVMATNGKSHFICRFSEDFHDYTFLKSIPPYDGLLTL